MQKFFITVFCVLALALPANAQHQHEHVQASTATDQLKVEHSVGMSWGQLGFNSTHSKNSDKKTFGTIGLNYACRFNRWITLSGDIGWTHSWFSPDADPALAYPKKDNAILILAGCNISWFQSGILQLQSGVAGGLDIRVQKNDRGSYKTMALAGQFDALGAKLDWKRTYASLSVGWGSMGCVRLGVGIKL